MSMNVYNVIWADDDIDDLEVSYKKRFEKNGLQIIGTAHNGDELETQLSENVNFVDAVIVDANFNEIEVDIDDERDTSGLTFTRTHLLKVYPNIPFILFTQRSDELINEKYHSIQTKFAEEFPRHKRWFHKNDDEELSEMFDAIKSEVDFRKTDSFRIRNKYRKEFEAAKQIDDAERNLYKGLLFLYEENSWKDVQDYFNPARKIVERIKDKCIDMNILPHNTSLNNASRIFSGVDMYIGLKEEYMPKPLAESFFYLLKITQDGSHDENDMSLGVDKYVRDTKNINLYRTILYIAMDLLLWFDDIQGKFKENKEPLWKDKFIYEGKVCTGIDYNKKSFFYTKKYELQQNKDLVIKDGDIVRIYNSEQKKYPKGEITDFVKREFYRII